MNRVIRTTVGAALVLSAMAVMGQTKPRTDTLADTAFALEQQGRDAEAEAAWRAYLKTHSSNGEAYAHLGLIEARQERYKEAIPLYRRALALRPDFPGLRLNLGLAEFKAGDMRDAVEQFDLLLKKQPHSSPEGLRLKILIGMCYYGLGEFSAAVPYLKQAVAADPQNLTIRLTLAHSCLWSKQYQCVLDVYHEILNLNAESAEADMLAGEALDEMRDAAGAIEQFRAAVKANPNEPEAHFGLGYLLWKQKQFAAAEPEFQAELAINPSHADALVHLADSQLQLGHPDQALPTLEQAIKIDPSSGMAHLDMGIIYADSNRTEEGLRELTAAEKLAPDDVNVHWRLARLYRAMGKKDEAKAEFAKASSITKAADDAVLQRMHGGNRTGQSAEAPATGAAGRSPNK